MIDYRRPLADRDAEDAVEYRRISDMRTENNMSAAWLGKGPMPRAVEGGSHPGTAPDAGWQPTVFSRLAEAENAVMRAMTVADRIRDAVFSGGEHASTTGPVSPNDNLLSRVSSLAIDAERLEKSLCEIEAALRD